jgi:phosphate transport system ATP-binding protein
MTETTALATTGANTALERRAAAGTTGPAQALSAVGVYAWFGNRLVLAGVDLDVAERSVYALIGPSGCGKSTFIRTLNRTHELVPGAQSAGSVFLHGTDVYGTGVRATDVRRRVGMVFQKPNPFPAMTIAENVLAGPRFSGVRTRNKNALVEECLTRAGLWREVKDRLRTPGGALSGGQQQRLCIARALAVRPEVLLMDEPCSALDPSSTRRIEDTILELRDDISIVIVTHNMQQARRVSDHVAFFLADENEPGTVVEHGAVEDIFERPTDPRTADYIHGVFG